MLLIIDGSSMLSSSYYGNLPKQILFAKTEEERSKYYDKIMHAPDGTYTNGLFTMLRTVLKILKNQNPEYIVFVFDKMRDTFRRELYADYKGTRGETPAPLKQQFVLAEEMFKELGFKVFASSRYEADDYAGSLAKKFCGETPVTVMTKDADYLQLVDDSKNIRAWMVQSDQKKTEKLMDMYYGEKIECLPDKVFEFTEQYIEGEYGLKHGYQIIDLKALSGDTSDNIPGVKGISDKTAGPLLREYGTVEALYEALEDEGSKIEDFWKEYLGMRKGSFKKLTAEGAKASALLSKQLATIKTDIPLDVTLKDLRCHLNHEAFEKIIEKFGFSSLKGQL